MAQELTDKQKKVLKMVQAYWTEFSVSPSLADLAAKLGVRRSTVHQHLLALKKKGYLEHMEGAGRTWRPTAEPASNTLKIPLVGRVAAGLPILAKENIDDWITVGDLAASDQHFALRVCGDSMIEGGILDGDIVIARQQQVAENGDIVIALVNDNEATVKKFHREGDTVRLLAMNPKYQPIVLRGDRIQIQGKVVGLRRRLDQH